MFHLLTLSAVLNTVPDAVEFHPRGVSTPMTTETVPDAVAKGAVFPGGQPWQYQLNNNTASTGWIIHMSGGGWNFMKNSSVEAVQDGTKKRDGTNFDSNAGCYGICDGILSNDQADNPDFHAYNKVFILIAHWRSYLLHGRPLGRHKGAWQARPRYRS